MGLEDYEGAARCYTIAAAMSDSINMQESRMMAESAIDLLEHKYDLAQRKWWMTMTIVSTVALLLFSIMLIVYNRIISHRNRTMSATLNKMLYYREKVIQNEGRKSDGTDENEADDVYPEELARFKEIDHRITEEELFRNPGFGRDDLMRLTGLDKNRLPAFIQQFAGTNIPGYINAKRMEYAADMMRQHPDYTMNAIAEACGIMSAATFIRNFKAVYGMAPSDFRKETESIYPPTVGQNEK
jgi:AraC-like DNA-binding protein